mgnify:FL=1
MTNTMNADTFTISRNNLGNLMKDAIQLYIEYVECYLQGHDVAVACAVSEVIESLDAELELYQDGSLKKEELTQVVDNPLSQVIESNAKLIKLLNKWKEQRVL